MKHGWAFLSAVTGAIESWSGDILARDAGAFLYRGADLRHAVERSLFFAVANDPLLMAYFDAVQEGAARPALAPNRHFQMILPYLDPQCASMRQPRAGLGRRLRTRIGNLSRLGRAPFHAARLKSSDFLFLAIHPKFVSFMAPVAERLNGAFLCFNDPAMEEHLGQAGRPTVALRPSHSNGTIPPALEHFAFLCQVFDAMSAMMKALLPRVILVPEGNAPIYEIANRAGRQNGVKTVCLQQGAPAYTNPGFRNWSFNDVLVWGNAFIEPYARHNPRQHFSVTGTPAALPAPSRETGSAPFRSIGFFLQKGVAVIPAEEWAGMLRLIVWAAQSWPGIEIIVRDHPSQPSMTAAERAQLEVADNIRFMPWPDFSLGQVLTAVDVAVAAASTTLLEAVQVGAIPFVFGTAYPADFPDISAAAAMGPDLASAQRTLTQLVEDGGRRAALRGAGQVLRPDLFAASGADAAERIAQKLKEIAG